MNTKKKSAVRRLLLFLAIMLALTFFSRTLYLATLPQVTAVRLSGGYLTVDIPASTPILYSETVKEIIPCKYPLASPLSGSRIQVRQNQAVRQGETLIEFDAHWAESALAQAKSEYDSAAATQAVWKSGCDQQLRELAEKQKRLSTEGGAADSREALQALDAERRLLEQDEIYNGVPLSEVRARCEAARSVYESLSRLKQNNWRIAAPENLWIAEISLKEGDDYRGVAPVLRYIPQTAEVYAGAVYTDSPQILKDAASISVVEGDGQASDAWKYSHMEPSENGYTLWAALADPLHPDLPEGGLTFHLETGYYSTLVPKAALCQEGIYLAQKRAGAWGQTEDYACLVKGKYSLSDDQYVLFETTASLNGEPVLIDWDRAFNDGDTVYVTMR